VLERLGGGLVLDVGCGEGLWSARLCAPGRAVLAVDDSQEAAASAKRQARGAYAVAQMDALCLGLAPGSVDAVCSSHLIEHFLDPEPHVAEVARVTAGSGTAFFLTPNAPADFENPFHLRLFGPHDLGALLGRHFAEVWVGGVDGDARVKADFAARRAKAARLLRLDVLGVRHRIPRRWYVALYASLLPLAYAAMAHRGQDDPTVADLARWSVTEEVDETTLVLFAVCRRPRRPEPRA